jgi:putative ABC transport system permease protein
MDGDFVGWGALVASLLFVLVAVVLTSYERLRLERSIIVAVARSLAQMLVVGAALVPIVDPDTPLAWSWAWVVGIVVFAGITVARRAPAVPRLWQVAVVANAAVATTGLSIIFGLGIFDLNGRTLVPVAGMLVGNSMKGGVVAASRVSEAVAEHRREIEAGLALGMTTTVASRRFVRSALRTAISPQVEQTAALGIVFLPGAMTGLILAGVDPLDAVRAQLALMYVILAGVVIAATITGLGTLARLSTPDHRIVQLAR